MWKATEKEAIKLKKFFESKFDFPFVVRPVPGGRGFQVNAIRSCSRCNQKMEQGGGFDKPAVCEICARDKCIAIAQAAWEHGEQRREADRRSLDFEEVCQ